MASPKGEQKCFFTKAVMVVMGQEVSSACWRMGVDVYLVFFLTVLRFPKSSVSSSKSV